MSSLVDDDAVAFVMPVLYGTLVLANIRLRDRTLSILILPPSTAFLYLVYTYFPNGNWSSNLATVLGVIGVTILVLRMVDMAEVRCLCFQNA